MDLTDVGFVVQQRGHPSFADNPDIPEITDPDELAFMARLKIYPRHQAGFLAYYDPENVGSPLKSAAEAASVGRATIAAWKHKPWWKALYERHVAKSAMDFHMRLSASSKDIADGMLTVARGDDKTDRTANARVRVGEVYARIAAPGAVPLLNTKPDVNINNTTNNNLIVQGVLDHSKILAVGRTNPAAILEMARTSTIPDEYRLKNEEAL